LLVKNDWIKREGSNEPSKLALGKGSEGRSFVLMIIEGVIFSSQLAAVLWVAREGDGMRDGEVGA